jgi:hypothetical protein
MVLQTCLCGKTGTGFEKELKTLLFISEISEMSLNLLQNVARGDWFGIVNELLEEDTSYKKACLEKDLYKAKKTIREGFSIKSYLWNEPFDVCDCGLPGCFDFYAANPSEGLVLTIEQNFDLLDNLVIFGLLTENDITFQLLNFYFKPQEIQYYTRPWINDKMTNWLYNFIPVKRLEEVIEGWTPEKD